jgi:Zn-dependent protease
MAGFHRMTPTRKGSFHLFHFAGVDVFLHWSWFLVALYAINYRMGHYSSAVWNLFEYLALFGIVLMHEFGHSLACRSVGGQANQIVLWPLGGVAYVSPPPRPGPTLWSIAAGPLVNVMLFPVLTALLWLSRSAAWPDDLSEFVKTIWQTNLGLLIFNLLPIFPLDGGQILRSLLWFVVGRAQSLMATSVIGFVGVAGLIGFAVLARSAWLGIIAVFILLNCWGGLLQARVLARAAKAPRHAGFACPACQTAPPVGHFWLCGQCRKSFDTFASRAVCPHCGAQFAVTRCLDCGEMRPFNEWMLPPPLPTTG